VVSNPVFGLDFSSVALIHQRIVEARNQGAAVLLLSEDLDELLALSDRIMVIHAGHINYAVDAAAIEDRGELGHYMAGGTQRGSSI
ncbi:TPA: heme ABC transporter ATP-binding protein, partial [Klebsiella pneumoniae]